VTEEEEGDAVRVGGVDAGRVGALDADSWWRWEGNTAGVARPATVASSVACWVVVAVAF